MTQPRTPRRKSSFSVKDLQDYDGETPELEIVSEAQEQKRRKLLDDIDGGKLKSTNELHSSKTVRHKDSGDRDAGYSEKHEEGNLAKRNHQLQTVNFLDCIPMLALNTIYSNALFFHMGYCPSP
jgi:hypothetical protein